MKRLELETQRHKADLLSPGAGYQGQRISHGAVTCAKTEYRNAKRAGTANAFTF